MFYELRIAISKLVFFLVFCEDNIGPDNLRSPKLSRSAAPPPSKNRDKKKIYAYLNAAYFDNCL